MNVKQLKEIINNIPDETPVLLESIDHEYCDGITANFITALYDKKSRVWTEDFSDELTSEAEFGKRTRIVLIY